MCGQPDRLKLGLEIPVAQHGKHQLGGHFQLPAAQQLSCLLLGLPIGQHGDLEVIRVTPLLQAPVIQYTAA